MPTLADRALLEVLDDTGALACADCRRVVGVPTDPNAWPISFGIIGTPNATRVRIRLFLGAEVDAQGLPSLRGTIDQVAILPPPAGVTDVAVTLLGACTNLPADVEAHSTCHGPSNALEAETMAAAGRPTAPLPNTWSVLQPQPCTATAPDDMVCLAGGYFVLGSENLPTGLLPDQFAVDTFPDGTVSSTPPRLVALPPFFLDRREITVGDVRALANQQLIDVPAASTADNSGCVFPSSTSDGSADALALNCVIRREATAICAALHKRLPTEAEWEYAAGNLDKRTRFPWGNEPDDPCANADVGLGNALDLATCRFRPGASVLPGGLPAARNPGDKTFAGVEGLAGGVAEYVVDAAAPYDAACWKPDESVLDNPRCDEGTLVDPTKSPLFVTRGAGWADPPGLVQLTLRRLSQASTNVGFRCAMDQPR